MLCLLIYAVLLISWSEAEFFTSVDHMEPLVGTLKRVIDDLDLYIEKEEERLTTIKRYLDTFKQEHERAVEDNIANYIGNPINAFNLIKCLTADLDTIEKNITAGKEFKKNETVQYPNFEDLRGAAMAFTRLQTTYRLPARELSEGILKGVKYSTPLSAQDCKSIGDILYSEYDYTNSLLWMKEAFRKFQEEEQGKEDSSNSCVEIINYIGYMHYTLGDIQSAMEWTAKQLEINPNYERGLSNMAYYIELINRGAVQQGQETLEAQKQEKSLETQSEWPVTDVEDWDYPFNIALDRYGALCRGDMELSAEVTKKLKCWYTKKNHAFLKYAPFKIEQAYIQPNIYIFHDVLSDHEIETVKEKSLPKFERAAVAAPDPEARISDVRVGKVAWIRDEDSILVSRISQRVKDMTGLDLESAEELQIVNYGIGGQYEPHYDFSRGNELIYETEAGNRIATLLFYLSNVTIGGATVFTELGLTVPPVKGTAVLWWNLHPSGDRDRATRHAACPVVLGSKWIATRWMHEQGQEFMRPCELEFQSEQEFRRLPPPVPRMSR